jgi:hypothetical protein
MTSDRPVDIERTARTARHRATKLAHKRVSDAWYTAALTRHICPNCLKPGSHFVPPMMGEHGFFICDGGGGSVGKEIA